MGDAVLPRALVAVLGQGVKALRGKKSAKNPVAVKIGQKKRLGT
jgi:hypothetical protein